MTKTIKGWKNTDKNLKCRDFQFVVGESYHQDGGIELCGNGFHFHENSLDIFKYYDRESVVVEIEAWGEIKTGDDKSVCSDIKIIRVVPENEIKKICNLVNNTGLHNSGYRNSGNGNSGNRNSGNGNSGNRNSGDWNSGYGNSGYRNSGYGNSGYGNSGYGNSGNGNSGNRNSGDWNSGNRNSGDWNSTSLSSGHFNTKEVKTIKVFNKDCKVSAWDKAVKPSFIYFELNLWVAESSMSDQEKIDHPEFYCQQGYLKPLSYHEAWKRAWDNKQDGDIELLEALPNFDWKVFTEISGIEKPGK